MSWTGDQYGYSPVYVRALLDVFWEIRERAYAPTLDPGRPEVMAYYDLIRVLSECEFSGRQWEALSLRMEGRTQWEIACMLGISRRAVRDRLYLAESKIKSMLCYTANNTRPEGK